MHGTGAVLGNIPEIAAGGIMVLMFLSTFTNVLARYLFNSPIEWAEELSRYAFVWLVFLGAAACTKRKRHIVIENLVLVCPGRVQSLLRVLAHLATLVLMTVVLLYGWKLMRNATQSTATLMIPKAFVYSVIPFTALSIILYSVGDLLQDAKAFLQGGES
jgi:TRAP-type C4-dicarboxylate transport system permease small subunit